LSTHQQYFLVNSISLSTCQLVNLLTQSPRQLSFFAKPCEIKVV